MKTCCTEHNRKIEKRGTEERNIRKNYNERKKTRKKTRKGKHGVKSEDMLQRKV